MATAVHFPIDDYGITDSEYQHLLSESTSEQADKLINFRQSFKQLRDKVNSGKISINDFYKRAGKLSQRFNNFAQSTYESFGGRVRARLDVNHENSEIRRRYRPVEEDLEVDTGEEIELFNRGEVGPGYGAVESTIGAGTELGGVSTTGSAALTPALALGTGLVTVAGGAALLNKAYQSGIQVPGTNYVGPGNPIDNGPPTSFVDEDARRHDIEYSQPGTDIGKSDREAIKRFGDHHAEEGDVTSLLGVAGLEIKQKVEQLAGPIYPREY